MLPEQADPPGFQSVLDVGCGIGGWLLNVAQTIPSVEHLVGVDISRKMIEMEYSREASGWQQFCEDMQLLYQTIRPFLQKWIRVPDDYDEIYQQMLTDIQQPDFVARGAMLSAWGTVK